MKVSGALAFLLASTALAHAQAPAPTFFSPATSICRTCQVVGSDVGGIRGVAALDDNKKIYPASIPAPTGSGLGGVKAGTNITIATDGTISASGSGGGLILGTTTGTAYDGGLGAAATTSAATANSAATAAATTANAGLPKAGGTMTGTLVAPKITLANAPTTGTDATNKTYVDTAVAGAGSGVPNVTVFSGTCDDATDNASLVTTLNSTLHAGDTLRFPPEAQPCLSSVSFQPVPGVSYFADYGTVEVKPTASANGSPLLFGVANASGAPIYIHGLIFDGGSAEFTASVSSSGLMTVSSVLSGEINVNKLLFGPSGDFPAGEHIASLGTGTGGTGTYQLSANPTPGAIASHTLVTGVTGSTNTMVQCFDLPNLQFDHVTFQNTLGLGVFLNGCGHQSIEYSTIQHIGNLWYATGVSTDRHQGVGTQLSSSNQTDIHWDHNYFSDIGLDATSPNSVDHFSVSHNTASMNNNGLALATTDYSAFVFCSECSYGIIDGNNITGASGNGLDQINSDHMLDANNFITFSGEAGMGFFNTPWSSAVNNIILDSGQLLATALPGAITVTTNSSNFVATGNQLGDDQSTPTQQFGLWIQSGSTITNAVIQDNGGAGNTHSLYGGLAGAPTLSSCGTSPSILSTSTRDAGTVTAGSGATSCTLTFQLPFSSVRGGSATDQSAIALGATATTTTLVVTGTGLGGTSFTYGVIGQ
jgi:hypothetical protein